MTSREKMLSIQVVDLHWLPALHNAIDAAKIVAPVVCQVPSMQGFHWFATEDALREIHRILKPGAAFCCIWNRSKPLNHITQACAHCQEH